MRSTAVPSAVVALSLPLFAALIGCSGGDGEVADDVDGIVTTDQIASALLPTEPSGCDQNALAGAGWVSTAMPSTTGAFSVVLRVTPEIGNDVRPPVVDAVLGLSNGAATRDADLGPAVRFNTNGTIDVRNGDAYSADQAFPYTSGRGPYEVRFDVDVPSHTYSVSVRHLDQLGKPMEKIATSYAFRAEQQAVARLDSVNRYVDGTVGGVQTCGFAFTPIRAQTSRTMFVPTAPRPSRSAMFQRQ